MLRFYKTSEIIERVEDSGGFLLLRELQSDEDLANIQDDKIISDIITSKFHYWQGETKPEGITIQTSLDLLANQKFYGFFDNSKIRPEHYQLISFEAFKNKLSQAIKEYADYDKRFIGKAHEIIRRYANQSFKVYYLNLDNEINFDLVAEWHVYGFFYAFISIDRLINIVTLIEFGLD